MRSWAYNRFGVLMGASWRASALRWPRLREDIVPMITPFPSQGYFCATAMLPRRLIPRPRDGAPCHDQFPARKLGDGGLTTWGARAGRNVSVRGPRSGPRARTSLVHLWHPERVDRKSVV